MRRVRLLVLAIVLVLLAGYTPQPIEAGCTDCYLVDTPWGTEWLCLDLNDPGYKSCIEIEQGCLIWFACWLG